MYSPAMETAGSGPVGSRGERDEVDEVVQRETGTSVNPPVLEGWKDGELGWWLKVKQGLMLGRMLSGK